VTSPPAFETAKLFTARSDSERRGTYAGIAFTFVGEVAILATNHAAIGKVGAFTVVYAASTRTRRTQ
jgi:hypothetical protein